MTNRPGSGRLSQEFLTGFLCEEDQNHAPCEKEKGEVGFLKSISENSYSIDTQIFGTNDRLPFGSTKVSEGGSSLLASAMEGSTSLVSSLINKCFCEWSNPYDIDCPSMMEQLGEAQTIATCVKHR